MIRDLTAEEKAHIKQQKEKANKYYSEIRKKLTAQLIAEKKGQKGYLTQRARDLESKRDAVPTIKGTPVYFVLGETTILLNYDLIKKSLNLTKKFTRELEIESQGLYLIVCCFDRTTKGRYEFIELPDEYTLLDGLPTIELERVYFQ